MIFVFPLARRQTGHSGRSRLRPYCRPDPALFLKSLFEDIGNLVRRHSCPALLIAWRATSRNVTLIAEDERLGS